MPVGPLGDRLFVDSPIRANRATLAGAEAHHLIHVMRVQCGAEVALFDGSGDEFAAEVDRIGRSEVELRIISRATVDRELPRELVLAVALPKGDRQKWLVEKAVELGVGRLVPLRTARGVAQPVSQTLTRLRRSVIAASKQCGRNRLMVVASPADWSDYVADTREAPFRMLAHPQAGGLTLAQQRHGEFARGVHLAVGPEGGFAEEEVTLAKTTGWQIIDLGPRILRVETAAIVLGAVVGQLGCHSRGDSSTGEPNQG